MKNLSPVVIVLIAFISLLAGFLSSPLGEVRQLRVELEYANTKLSEATTALSQERAKITAARELRNFSSVEELEIFLGEDKTNEHEYVKSDFDCEDFALMLQENALERGYLLNCQVLPVKGIHHMMNMAIIGNSIYYIEPRTDGFTFVNYLDKNQ